MVLKIRLARFGKRNAPFYNIVVAQARTARNSKPLEVLGTYDPIPKPAPLGEGGKPFKDIKLDTSRAKYWLGVGAQPSEPAWRLLSMVRVRNFPRSPGMGRRRAQEKWEHGAGEMSAAAPTVLEKGRDAGSAWVKVGTVCADLMDQIGLMEPKYSIQKMQQTEAEQRAARSREADDPLEGR